MNYFSYQKGAFGHGFSSNIFRKYFSIFEDFRNVLNVELKYQYLLPENWSHDNFFFFLGIKDVTNFEDAYNF